MSGVPGSGKSTLARRIAAELSAVVLDHDETKSAILASGVAEAQAGAASYEVIKTLTRELLSQGHSVIVDSPCLYPQLLEYGQNAAEELDASYRYIECVLNDMEALDRRLQARVAKPSQVRSLNQSFSHAGAPPRPARDLIAEWAVRAVRPEGESLVVDTSVPLAECVERALTYVLGGDERTGKG